MKFSIENFKTTSSRIESNESKISNLEKDIEKNLSRFCYEVLVKDQEIGFGNFSYVYEDTHDNGICYKKYKPNAEARMRNTAYQEMGFMEKVYGLDKDVKTPYPLGLAEVVIKNNENGSLFLNKIIAMEHFEDATRLEDVIDPQSSEVARDFPESFDADSFFTKLTSFIEKMHMDLGIYHADLFSRNILIDNKTGNPIVIDFGDASYPSLDGTQDAYGRQISESFSYEDKDLKNIEIMKREVEKYIDKSK